MNKEIINYLNNEINEEKISHAFLVETNNCEKLMQEIGNLFISHNLIPSQKLDNNISVSIIKPENGLIDKDKILNLQKFIMTTSIIKKCKVYFILNAELMNLSSFNKLLKVLEEPNESVIGFLLTENENLIIPTIKSRCEKFKNYYEVNLDEEDTTTVQKLNNIIKLNYNELLELKKEIMKNDKYQIIDILRKYKNSLINDSTDIKEINILAKQYKILDNIIDLIKSNVNLELCLDKLFIEMRNQQ